MENKDINLYCTPPEGYAPIPLFENGTVDTSKVIIQDTPFGKVGFIPIERHPYLRSAIEATKNAGYMDEDGKFTKKMAKTARGIWVRVYSEAFHMDKCDWKYFEEKWECKNLQQNTIKKNNPYYDKWYGKIKTIFRNAGFDI